MVDIKGKTNDWLTPSLEATKSSIFSRQEVKLSSKLEGRELIKFVATLVKTWLKTSGHISGCFFEMLAFV